MESEDFPSFKKTPSQNRSESRAGSLFLILCLVGVLALVFALSFRFLVGAQTERDEILPRILASSKSRQRSLLQEWIQNIETAQDMATKEKWSLTSAEQETLMQFLLQRREDFKQESPGPGNYALILASLGPHRGDQLPQDFLSESFSRESKLAVFLFLIRQHDFSAEAMNFAKALVNEGETFRKLLAVYCGSCLASRQVGEGGRSVCALELKSLLQDPVDEVRWNAAFGIARLGETQSVDLEAETRGAAKRELNGLFEKIEAAEQGLMNRFGGLALETLAREVFHSSLRLRVAESRQRLERISREHPELSIRGQARRVLAEHENVQGK